MLWAVSDDATAMAYPEMRNTTILGVGTVEVPLGSCTHFKWMLILPWVEAEVAGNTDGEPDVA